MAAFLGSASGIGRQFRRPRAFAQAGASSGHGHNRCHAVQFFCAGLGGAALALPFTSGPVAATLPYLAGMTVAAVLLLAWPARALGRDAAICAVAAGWLAAALASSGSRCCSISISKRHFFPG